MIYRKFIMPRPNLLFTMTEDLLVELAKRLGSYA